MSTLSTHVLDTSLGRPARGVPVVLERRTAERTWSESGRGKTDKDGRIRDLLAGRAGLKRGRYRLTFGVAAYFRAQRRPAFYAEVSIEFVVAKPNEHYHVPLLLSPWGYSTYRGS